MNQEAQAGKETYSRIPSDSVIARQNKTWKKKKKSSKMTITAQPKKSQMEKIPGKLKIWS